MNAQEKLAAELHATHHPDAVRQRLQSGPSRSYLRDFVYGAVDGVVTTFAVVTGVAGANLSSGIIVVLGVANLVADGFSMAASNYLATRAERDRVQRAREIEADHIRLHPEGEREEIRQIFAAKGFTGEALEQAVSIVTADRKRWIDTMLQEEYGFTLEEHAPGRAGAATFGAFVFFGALPLLAFLVLMVAPNLAIRPYLASTVLAGASLFLIGAIKAQFVSRRWYGEGFRTLFVGGAAGTLAYVAGALLAKLVAP